MIRPLHIRGARALLGMKQVDLARMAGLSIIGLNDIERGTADPKVSILEAIKAALEHAGVEFIPENNGGGPGVRLRKARI